MSADFIEASAVSIFAGLASKAGIDLTAEQLTAYARQWLTIGVALLDNHAKADAAQAGNERAAKVMDMESAEAAAKERK